MDNEITAYATVEDLEARWKTLTTEEQAIAEVLLLDAAVKLRMEYKKRNLDIPTDEETLYALKIISCAMVKRVMSAPSFDDSIGSDIREFRTDVGILSESYGFANPDGSLYLKDDELKMLGLFKSGQLATIDPYVNIGG